MTAIIRQGLSFCAPTKSIACVAKTLQRNGIHRFSTLSNPDPKFKALVDKITNLNDQKEIIRSLNSIHKELVEIRNERKQSSSGGFWLGYTSAIIGLMIYYEATADDGMLKSLKKK